MKITIALLGLALICFGCAPTPKVKTVTSWQYRTLRLKTDQAAIVDSIMATNGDWITEAWKGETAYGSISDPELKADEMGEKGWEMVTAYIEQETILAEHDFKGSPIQPYPNTRPKTLVMIFKKAY